MWTRGFLYLSIVLAILTINLTMIEPLFVDPCEPNALRLTRNICLLLLCPSWSLLLVTGIAERSQLTRFECLLTWTWLPLAAFPSLCLPLAMLMFLSGKSWF